MDNEGSVIDSEPRAIIVGATHTQLRSFGRAIEAAGYRVTVIADSKDAPAILSARQAELLVYNHALGNTAILAGYQALPQHPALLLLDRHLALPSEGFARQARVQCDAQGLEALLRRHRATSASPKVSSTAAPEPAPPPARAPLPQAQSSAPQPPNTLAERSPPPPAKASPVPLARKEIASEPSPAPAPAAKASPVPPARKEIASEPSPTPTPPAKASPVPLARKEIAGEPSAAPAPVAKISLVAPTWKEIASAPVPVAKISLVAPAWKEIASVPSAAPAPATDKRKWPAVALWIGALVMVVLIAVAVLRLTDITNVPPSLGASLPAAVTSAASGTTTLSVSVAGNPLPTASQLPATAIAQAIAQPSTDRTVTSSALPKASQLPATAVAQATAPAATQASVQPGSDLTVEIVGVTPAQPQANQVMNIRVRVRNVGMRDITDPFWVDLYATPQRLPAVNLSWPDVSSYGSTWLVNGLAAGQSQLLETLSADPARSNLLRMPAASEQVYVLVDSYGTSGQGAVSEQDENNNMAGPLLLTVGKK